MICKYRVLYLVLSFKIESVVVNRFRVLTPKYVRWRAVDRERERGRERKLEKSGVGA